MPTRVKPPATRWVLLLACAALAGLHPGAGAQTTAPPAAAASAPPAAPMPLVRMPVAADHARAADALFQQGKQAAAIEALRAALALDGAALPVRRRLAQALAQAGRVNEATAEYWRLHRAAPDASTFLYLMGALRATGALVDAARLAQQAGGAFASDVGIASLAAEILLQLRDPRSALVHLQRIPADARTDGLRGRAAEGAGQWAQAYAAYTRLASSGSDPQAQSGRQRALRHAVAMDRLLVFAPAGWETVPDRAMLRNTASGAEVTVESRTQPDGELAARQAVAARVPASLFAGLPKEVGESIAAKTAEHKDGASGHFDVSALVLKGASDEVETRLRRMTITVERVASAPVTYAAAVASPNVPEGSRPDPVHVLVRGDVPVVFVATRTDALQARELLMSLALAEVVQP